MSLNISLLKEKKKKKKKKRLFIPTEWTVNFRAV